MYHFNNKLLLSLLLSSTIAKESSLNQFVLDTCEDLPSTLLGFAVLKQYKKRLPAETFLGAKILKRYITHNTECSEDTAEKIAQCTVSLARRSINDKEGDDPIYGYTLEKKPWISVPKTLLREVILNEIIRRCYEAADKLKIKHPPEIKENEKLYQGGEFLIQSGTRHAIDEALSYLLSKLGIESS